jgi:DNA-binding NarL/FixJ family response regulator
MRYAGSKPGDATTVGIVDGDHGARLRLRRILETSGEFRCVARYGSGEEAIREAPKVRPQIVLMGLRLPVISGFQCMGLLKDFMPWLRVVLVSEGVDLPVISAGSVADGDGYLTKPYSRGQCLAALAFARGRCRSAVQHGADAGVLSAGGALKSTRLLTEREEDVMRRLGKGRLYKEIADELGISFSAVHKHQHNIFLKLHVGNRTEAILRWHASKPAPIRQFL